MRYDTRLTRYPFRRKHTVETLRPETQRRQRSHDRSRTTVCVSSDPLDFHPPFLSPLITSLPAAFVRLLVLTRLTRCVCARLFFSRSLCARRPSRSGPLRCRESAVLSESPARVLCASTPTRAWDFCSQPRRPSTTVYEAETAYEAALGSGVGCPS